MRFYNALLFALFILILPNVYAATFDNVKTYTEPTPTEKYGSIEIKNFYGIGDTLAKYTLTDNSEQCLMDCYAEGIVELNIDAPLFDNIIFQDIDLNNKEITNKVYLFIPETIAREIPVYEKQCTTVRELNETKDKEICNDVWIKNNIDYVNIENKVSYNKEILKAGTYRWRIEGTKPLKKEKDWNEKVDWVAGIDNEYLGKADFTEWAFWNSSWGSRQCIEFADNISTIRVNEPRMMPVSFPSANVINCTNEIRVTECSISNTGPDCDGGTETEVDSYVWDSAYAAGKCQGAKVNFLTNVPSNANRTYCVYYNNAAATAPNYTNPFYMAYNFEENRPLNNSIFGIQNTTNSAARASCLINNTDGVVKMQGLSDGGYECGIMTQRNFTANVCFDTHSYLVGQAGSSGHLLIQSWRTGVPGGWPNDVTSPSYYYHTNVGLLWRVKNYEGGYTSQTPNIDSLGQKVSVRLEVNSTSYGYYISEDNPAFTIRATKPRNFTDINNAWDNRGLSIMNSWANSALWLDDVFVSKVCNNNYTFYNQTATSLTFAEESPDTNPPSSVTLNFPLNSTKYSKDITFNISATDTIDANLTCNITIDGVRNKTIGVATTVPSSSTIRIFNFAPGNHSWNATCGDNDANTNTSLTFIFEANAPPSVPALVPANASYQNDTSISLNCSSTDSNSDSITYGYYGDIYPAAGLDFIANNSYTSAQWNTTNGNGTYLWACNAFDGYDFSSYSANNTIYLSTVVLGTPRENHTNFTTIGDAATFTFNISFNNVTIRDINAVLTYEGENKTITETNISGSNSTLFNASFILPLVSGLTTNKFNWTIYSYYINGTKKQSTFSYTQEITGVILFNCTTEQNATTIRVLNISYRLEQSDLVNVSGNFRGTFNLWTSSRANNITVSMVVNDTKQFYVCITPNGTYNTDAQFQYNSPGYDYRDYYLINEELSNNSRHIELYLLEIALGTGITFTVQDEAENPLVGYYIKAERYDPGTNTYNLVGMGKTSESGNDLIYLRQNDAFYRFIVMNYDNVVLITIPQKVTTSTLILNIVPSTFGEILGDFDNLVYTLTYTNTSTTGTFSLNYDSTGAGTYRNCLKVLRKRFNGDTVICDTCQTAVAGTISCDIDLTLTGNYIATYYSSINPDSYIDSLQQIVEVVNQLKNKLGGEAVFLVAIVIGFVALSMTFSPVIPLVLTLVILVLFAMLGIFNVTYVSIVSIVLMGIVILSRIKD